MLPPPRELPDRAPRLADGRYVLLGRIGRGGMAGVYAAWDTAHEEWRAIKVLLPKHARDGGLRMRFEREGLTMQSLQHPNLVRVFEVGSGEKLPFLVMELINAGSLYRWTKTHGPMPPRMAVEAMIQLCAGVTAVHSAEVVHRDIKPRNVLVNWDGVLKLTDFGIAQLGDSSETRTGLAMGTLGFMSPEQLHDAKSVDLRTDIYAIGATFWSQLTGRKARDLFRLEDEPRLLEGIDEPIREILLRCLAYDRQDRYPSARALSSALGNLLRILPDDPDDAPPLPLDLGSLSFKSQPENTFSEILTTLNGDLDGTPVSADSRDDHSGGDGSETPAVERQRAPRAAARLSSPPDPVRPPPSLPLGSPPAVSVGAARPVVRAHPRDAASDTAVPSYLMGVEQPIDVRRPELISYTPEPQPVRVAPPRVRWLRMVVGGLIVVPTLTFVAIAGIVGLVVADGAYEVTSATASVDAAQRDLSDRLRLEEALPRELELLGSDGDALRGAYNRWMRSQTEPERSEAAREFVLLAEQEARVRIGFDARSHEALLVRQRLERMAADRDRLDAAEVVLAEAASSLPGRLSIGLRLADPETQPAMASSVDRR